MVVQFGLPVIIASTLAWMETTVMMSFRGGRLQREAIPMSVARLVDRIGECKGKQQLFAQQSPQLLESLRQCAIVQSTESSNRIEVRITRFRCQGCNPATASPPERQAHASRRAVAPTKAQNARRGPRSAVSEPPLLPTTRGAFRPSGAARTRVETVLAPLSASALSSAGVD